MAKTGRLDFILVFVVIALTVVRLDHTFIFPQILFQVAVILNLRRRCDNLSRKKGETFPNYFQISHYSLNEFSNLLKILIPFIQVPQQSSNLCICGIKKTCFNQLRSKSLQKIVPLSYRRRRN